MSQLPRSNTNVSRKEHREGTVGLYVIPDGCICKGDGLFGMKCEAEVHAYLRNPTREQILEVAGKEV